ncbi:hypothetical protein BGX26_002809 [Mortierella sp. AD094]|nr:hypothetical protein BGX26_002809 [Mortierella sp. AD094]
MPSYHCPTPPIINQPTQQQHQHQHQHHPPPPSYNRRNSDSLNVASNGRTAVGGRGDDGGYSSGYDSPTGVSSSVPYSYNNYNNSGFSVRQQQQQQLQHQQLQLQLQQQQQQQQQTTTYQYSQQTQQRHYHRSHSRTHSNASETSRNIDTDIVRNYSPGPASLSSASSSRRGGISDANSGEGIGSSRFYSRKKTFQLVANSTTTRGGGGGVNSDADDGLDMDLGNKGSGNSSGTNSSRRQRQKKMSRRSSNSKGSGDRMSNILNDWDMLLPSSDPYGDDEGNDDDDDGMTDNERWKRSRQLMKRGWESSRGQGIIICVLVMVAIFTRIWKLVVPSAVVFDEQHIGVFTRNYLNGSFFMDVHPPLGKMLFSLVAYLLNFDGKFDFVIGKLYARNVPFIGMRMFAAACGVGLVPISYLIIKNSGHSTQAAITCAILVTFENALVTQSRFILLDSPMMLFMGYAMLAWINFYNHRNRPFTRGWWTWLLQTGVGLFLSSSVKWVGLFTVATIGLCVLKYLQESRTHLYISTEFNFQLLSNSETGDSWVSSQFRMALKGHDIQPVMADIAWQSKIHMRHANTNGGWVHSMPGEYAREGTIDQAIQLVEWDDDLTCWQVHAADPVVKEEQAQKYIAREKDRSLLFDGYIHDGDSIRLKHCYTKMALSINNLISTGSNKPHIREMRGINWPKNPTPDTVWRVELVPQGSVPGLADDYGLKLDSFSEDKLAQGDNAAWANQEEQRRVTSMELAFPEQRVELLQQHGNEQLCVSHGKSFAMVGSVGDRLRVYDSVRLTPFYSVSSGTFFAGWAIHYLPFFMMDRQLYLYHYLPAMYFSILLLVSRIDRIWQNWSKKFRYTAGLLVITAIILSWHSLSPLAYGIDFNSKSQCETARSLGGWEFVCQRQNLALARPQAAAAKIVVEERSDHEQHSLSEDTSDSQFYYQGSGQHSSDKIDHEHDHAGPFNVDESEHYRHEHFHHPHGPGHGRRHAKGHSHGHDNHNAAAEKQKQQQQ